MRMSAGGAARRRHGRGCGCMRRWAGLMGKAAAAKSAAPVLAGKAAVAGRLSDMVRDRFSTWRSQARCSVRSNRRAGAVAHHRSAAATGSHAEAREKPAGFMRHSC